MKQERRKFSKKWTLPDIVDLEYFLEQDQGSREEETLKKRDRQFYLNRIHQDLEQSDAPGGVNPDEEYLPRQAILKWLELRREAEKKQKQDPLLPGDLYRETASFMTWLFLFAGLFLGITVVASFFSYSGTRTLNISYYLTLTLLDQLILLGVLVAGFVFSRTGRVSTPMPLFQRFFAHCVHKTMETLKQKSQRHISRDHQYAMVGALGLIRAKHRIYGPLFFWPLFILGQVFAVGFNVGVIGMTLARVFFSDTAFGWQSTLQVGPELVHRLVSVVALPWSWFFPQGIAFPTLEQIAGSRMILKDGIYHLSTGNLISWWPFLCLCVFFYGLLPRLFLAGVGQWMKNRCLDGLAFNHAACQRLLARMTTPLVSIDGVLVPKASPSASPSSSLSRYSPGKEDFVTEKRAPSPKENDAEVLSVPVRPKFEKALLGSRRALVLVSEDLEELLNTEELSQQVLRQCGATIAQQMLVGEDSSRELGKIKSLCASSRMSSDKNSQISPKKIKQKAILDHPTSINPKPASKISSPEPNTHSLESNTQNPTTTQYTVAGNQHSEPNLLSSISKLQDPDVAMEPISSIVWLHESWQPPIRESLSFLQELRRVAGDGMDIIVGLVGKPTAATLFTPPSDMDMSVWQKKLDALGDPWLRIASMEK